LRLFRSVLMEPKAELSEAPSERGNRALTDLNARHGEKGGFRKITMTLPQSAYRILVQESARRKIAGEPKQLLSDLLREAVTEYLVKLRETSV
jgi:hypothetical protein